MHGGGSSANKTSEHVPLRRRSSTRLARLRGREIWIVSMWHRIGKRGRAGTDEWWIWWTLFIYSLGQNGRRALESKTILNNDPLTVSDLEGCVRTRRPNSKEFLTRGLSVDHWLSHKFPRSKSHGPPGYDDTTVWIVQAYIFTGLEIQVKVIVQIFSALELENKRERGWAYNGPRQNRPQLILWRWFYCGLLRPGYEGKPLHNRK